MNPVLQEEHAFEFSIIRQLGKLLLMQAFLVVVTLYPGAQFTHVLFNIWLYSKQLSIKGVHFTVPLGELAFIFK